METRHKKKYWYLILTLLVIILIFPFSIQGMNQAILRNAQMMGQEIARGYALNEGIYTGQYETILNTMEYQLRPENRTDECSVLIRKYLEFVHDTMELESVEIYASIDGQIEAATYWEGDAAFDPLGAEWYQKAIDADGETIYTDVYTDVRLKKKVVTIAKKIQGTSDVVAVDIYPENIHRREDKEELPEGSNYYLSDASGTLLYYDIGSKADGEDVQKTYFNIFSEIRQGIHDAYDSHVKGIDGQKRGVYYYKLDSGWYAVITIPYKALLKTSNEAMYIFLAVIGVFLVMFLLFAVLDYRNNKKAKLYNEIVGVLGNSYYALYLINLEQGEYHMLKGSDRIRDKIEAKGSYEKLLSVIPEVIQGEDSRQFTETFSVENMRKLVRQRVRDFGGDFKRMFNGEYRWVHVQMLYDESLQKNTVVLCFKDINEAKERDLVRLEFLKNSLESVDKMAKARNIFFSQMSHDMRTPLNGIIGLSRLALQKTRESYTREALDKIVNLGETLLGLINDILEMSKLEEGKLELRKESFEIRKNLKELASVFRLQTEGSQKKFHVRLDIEEAWIEGDWGRILQILNNLLSNAFKFTKEDGEIWFTVTENIDKNSRYRQYSFTVRDNGAGMSQEFLKKIFIPFERETRFGAANVTGTGLGMPIVHELVHKMDGTVEVTSELGKGSTFKVVIPCWVSEKDASKEKEEPEKEEEKPLLSGRRVLVAEDNEINMEIAAEVLAMYELEVEKAWNGQEALEKYLSHEPGYFDFILMDMQMPILDGCGASEAIRKSGRKDSKTIPIIAVTANAFAEDITRTKKAGMNAHISKPIDFHVLKETMERFLGKNN